MTIDEVITHIRNEYNSLKYHAEINGVAQEFFPDIEYHRQLVEWLEELKVYKECNISKTNFSMGYNKAIDDFAERLHDFCGYEEDGIQYPYVLHESRIDEIAGQLKMYRQD